MKDKSFAPLDDDRPCHYGVRNYSSGHSIPQCTLARELMEKVSKERKMWGHLTQLLGFYQTMEMSNPFFTWSASIQLDFPG